MTTATRRVRRVLGRWCDGTTMERLVDPILADIELERVESRRSGRTWQARWIVLTGYAGLGRALAQHGARACARSLSSDQSSARTIWYSGAAFALLTFVLTLPPLVRDASRGWTLSEHVLLAIYLVPQALPLSVPLALSCGILCAWPVRSTTRSTLRRILVVTTAATVLSVASMEWFMPKANQGFRVMVFRRIVALHRPNPAPVLTRGYSERSLTELASLVRATSGASTSEREAAKTIEEIAAAQQVRFSSESLRFMLHQRIALCFASALLAILAIGTQRAVPRRAPGRMLFAVLVTLYAAAWLYPARVADVYGYPAAAAAWLPNAAALLVSLLFVALGAVRSRTLSPTA